VEKVLEGRLKEQGWLSFLSKTSEVVSLDEVWRELLVLNAEGHARHNMVRDVCKLKRLCD